MWVDQEASWEERVVAVGWRVKKGGKEYCGMGWKAVESAALLGFDAVGSGEAVVIVNVVQGGEGEGSVCGGR